MSSFNFQLLFKQELNMKQESSNYVMKIIKIVKVQTVRLGIKIQSKHHEHQLLGRNPSSYGTSRPELGNMGLSLKYKRNTSPAFE